MHRQRKPTSRVQQLERKRTRFVLLIYRIPSTASAARVAVWRQLNKIGLVYLQQMAGVFPDDPRIVRELKPILRKVVAAGGEYHLLSLGNLPPEEREKLVARFRDQTSRHYKEIIENCEVNFVKEIEFEIFRKNFTYEEAEEIRTEFEKIVAWFERVRERDWFGAPNRKLVQTWLSRCERLLDHFEARVYAANQEGPVTGPRASRGRDVSSPYGAGVGFPAPVPERLTTRNSNGSRRIGAARLRARLRRGRPTGKLRNSELPTDRAADTPSDE